MQSKFYWLLVLAPRLRRHFLLPGGRIAVSVLGVRGRQRGRRERQDYTGLPAGTAETTPLTTHMLGAASKGSRERGCMHSIVESGP